MEKPIDLPKVLVCAPQHDSKKYCWETWKTTVKNLTYSNYDVYLADNSETGEFAMEMEEEGFVVERVGYDLSGVLERTTKAHEACRQYALNNNYDYMLHLETDVIPPLDVIERLLTSRKLVVSGVYDIFHGKMRKSMVQVAEPLDRFKNAYKTVPFIEHEEPLLYNGNLKQVYHAGIGCALISRKAFENVPFRFVKGEMHHADTWFANDCHQKDIPVFIDTTVQCKHLNGTWLDVMDEILNQ